MIKRRHLKGGPSDLGMKFYKNTKKSSLYSQSLLNFIHKTPVVENHPSTREIRFTTAQVETRGKHSLFLHEQIAHLHTQMQLQTGSNEDIMVNNYMFVMLSDLSIISHLILLFSLT